MLEIVKTASIILISLFLPLILLSIVALKQRKLLLYLCFIIASLAATTYGWRFYLGDTIDGMFGSICFFLLSLAMFLRIILIQKAENHLTSL